MPRHQATSRQILLHYCTSNQSFVPAAIVGRTLKSSSLQIPQPPRLRVARRPTTLVQPRGLGHSSALPPGATHTTEHKKLGYFYRRISTQNPTSVSVSPGFRGGRLAPLFLSAMSHACSIEVHCHSPLSTVAPVLTTNYVAPQNSIHVT